MPVVTTEHPHKMQCIAVRPYELPFVAPDLVLAHATDETIAAWYKTICEHVLGMMSITIDARGTGADSANHHLVDCYLTWFILARATLDSPHAVKITIRIADNSEFPFGKTPTQQHLAPYHVSACTFTSTPFIDTSVFSGVIFRVEKFQAGSPPPQMDINEIRRAAAY